MEESWIRLTLTYREPSDEEPELYFFEQDLYAVLYAYGCATVNEQDGSTLDGKGLEAGTKRLLCYFESDGAALASEVRSAAGALARRAGVALGSDIEAFTDNSWRDGWKAYFRPAQVSERIAVRAPWVELEVPAGVETIVIEPGMAFGTGLHETTQLCIRAIDRVSASGRVGSMLDVGCGSGVLSIAGCKCGIAAVRGIDNDPVCIDVSRENGELNGVGAEFDGTDIWDITAKYDLVVANIISSVLVALKEDLKAACREGGTLVLSGILAEERAEVEDAFVGDGLGLEKVSDATAGEWCSIEFVRRG